ncbi:MAG: hypothetical protein FD123_418 [Bacteroidetes bacterium]|nr:MAG: hypothetical protein FD123_418 [Bacteroidota bacterium]
MRTDTNIEKEIIMPVIVGQETWNLWNFLPDKPTKLKGAELGERVRTESRIDEVAKQKRITFLIPQEVFYISQEFLEALLKNVILNDCQDNVDLVPEDKTKYDMGNDMPNLIKLVKYKREIGVY